MSKGVIWGELRDLGLHYTHPHPVHGAQDSSYVRLFWGMWPCTGAWAQLRGCVQGSSYDLEYKSNFVLV